MKRNITSRLIAWQKNIGRKPLLLNGARQVGKTFSLKHFGASNFDKCHYLNCEEDPTIASIFQDSLNPAHLLKAISFHLNIQINPDTDILIIDEIQEVPRALTSLKYFCEELPKLAICAAGSLLGIHLNQGSFPVGKVDMLDMQPLSFVEFLVATGENQAVEMLEQVNLNSIIPNIVHEKLWELLKTYFIVGGLPEVVQAYISNKDNQFSAIQKVRQIQSVLINNYISDMAKHSGKLNAMHLQQLWKQVPSQLARNQDGSSKRFQFRNAVPGVQHFERLSSSLDWLENAGLIYKVPIVNCGQLPFTAYTKNNFFKLYLFDVGLLGALSQLPPEAILAYDYGTYKGYYAENFVLQELTFAKHKQIFSWIENKAEVEFLIEDQGNVLPIEVKSGWVTKAQSLKTFAQKYQPKLRTIMSANPLQVSEKSEVQRYPLYLTYRFPLFPHTPLRPI